MHLSIHLQLFTHMNLTFHIHHNHTIHQIRFFPENSIPDPNPKSVVGLRIRLPAHLCHLVTIHEAARLAVVVCISVRTCYVDFEFQRVYVIISRYLTASLQS